MPSHQPMKTYMKKTRVRMNTSVNSVDAVNALFVENLTKRFKSRKKAKIELKELPPQGPTQLTDDSLKVETNDTFDRLVKGKVYNEVKIVCNILKFNSSNSDTSVTYRSPIMTRRRKKTTALVTEVDSEESSTVDKPVRKNVLVCSSLKSNLSKSTSRSYRSSIMTRRRKKSTEEANSNENSEKSSTLDKPVTKSLSIEKESKHNFSTLSYIKLPRITEDQVMNNNQDPIFSDTFRERAFVHSSTPYVNTRRSKIVEDCISPIVSNPKSVSNPVSPVAKSDSSSSSELIEKSFDQIRKWDKNFPLEGQGVKVKRPRGRPRKLPLDSPKDKDWKLKCEVKVCVENCIPEKEGPADFQGFTCDEQRTGKELSDEFSQTVLDYSRDNVLRGFTPEEQSNSGEYSQECHNSFVSYNHDYTKRRQRLPKPSINSPKEAKSRTRRRSTRFTKVDFKRKSVRRKGLRTREKRQSFVTSRRPTASVAAKKTQAANSRKSKMKKCVDVTDDILSEKEMSYSHSESFDFSSSSSRVQIEELKDKEICLPKKNSVITVDLDDFDKFMQSYYLKDQTDDNKGEIKPETNSNSHNNRSLDFLISPPRPSTSTLSSKSDSKIVILSDITLGFNKKPLTDLNKSVEVVHHDHSYTNTPPSSKPPQCSILEPHLDLSDIIESSEDPIKPTQFKKPTKSLKLKPGKSYRRSLSLLRRSSVLVDVNVGCPEDCVCFKCMFKEKLNLDSSRKSQIVPVGRKSIGRSLLESYARSHLSE
ncbi:hypothetical protein Zmor_027692 [Zophobas morio]|uniref:Uncharacterized protein n=1 Tax=Zophobas morio TaxID=2755281 RepID=A0AA38HR83_9CUCU|nr:hypothetical protein Zmor_027692 [Zophobas morio]